MITCLYQLRLMCIQVMHQHADVGNIISMIILNLEIIDDYGRFQNFVLYLFNNHIFAVDQNQDISRAKANSICPPLHSFIPFRIFICL